MSKKRKSAAPSRSGKRSADNGYKDIDKYINSVLDFIKLHGAPEEYDEVWVNPEIKRMCFITCAPVFLRNVWPPFSIIYRCSK